MYRLARASCEREKPECLSAATAILETPCKAAFVHFQPLQKASKVPTGPTPRAHLRFHWPTTLPAVVLRLAAAHGATCAALSRRIGSAACRWSNEGFQLAPILSPTVSSCLFFYFFLSEKDGNGRSRATDTGGSECRLRPLGRPFFFKITIIDDFTSPQEAHITQTVAPFTCKSLIIKLNVAW